MSQEYKNIIIGGKGMREWHNGTKSDSTIFVRNFFGVSQGQLSTIVGRHEEQGSLQMIKCGSMAIG